jgi:Protein of unknown function (DUF2752)
MFEEKNLIRTLVWKIKKLWSYIGFEALVWMIGFAYLIFVHSPGETHFTICPLANLGFKYCPGCGLGNSISYIFKGDFIASFHSHPLGIFAFLIITLRVITIIKNNRRRYA